MKSIFIAIAFVATFVTSPLTYACQATVMGGCVPEPTHDTSSHMKSQIVNRVEPAKPAVISTKSASTVVNVSSNKSNNAGNLIQTVNKISVK